MDLRVESSDRVVGVLFWNHSFEERDTCDALAEDRLLLLFDNYRGLELLTLPCDMDTLEPKDRNPIAPNPGSLRK